MELAAKLALKPLAVILCMATSKLSSKLLCEEWAQKLKPQLHNLEAGIDALRTKELKAAKVHLDLARIRLMNDLHDTSASNDLGDAKREAIKALGVVSKVKEKVDCLELIFASEILLFLNLTPTNLIDFTSKFYSTRDQCLYFLKKLKLLPQVSQYFEIELKRSFSRGTFHDDRMAFLLSVFEIDLQVRSFFLCVLSSPGMTLPVTSETSTAVEVSKVIKQSHHFASDEVHESFQLSMEELFRKTKDIQLRELLCKQLDDLIDLFCITEEPALFKKIQSISKSLEEDFRMRAKEKISALISSKIRCFADTSHFFFLQNAADIRTLTGISFSMNDNCMVLQMMQAKVREFSTYENHDLLEDALMICQVSHVHFPAESDVVSEMLSSLSKKFIQYDDGNEKDWMACIPSMITLCGNLSLLDIRSEVGALVNEDHHDNISSSSSLSKWTQPQNVFTTEAGSKWISAKLSSHPFKEWICRSFPNQVKVIIIAIQSTHHLDNAPAKLCFEGVNEDENDATVKWQTLMEKDTCKWRGGEWRAFLLDDPGEFKHYRLLVTENWSSDVLGIYKLRFYV